jgi:hypothetical protein
MDEGIPEWFNCPKIDKPFTVHGLTCHLKLHENTFFFLLLKQSFFTLGNKNNA